LRPPTGYALDAAVGTTFTLDLQAALVVPLAFASFRLSGTADPIAVMEAVRGASNRVDLFCQAGQMTVPRQATTLFAFLEPMVHEVVSPRPGHLFHPKVWVLRYLADDEGRPPLLRVLCLTRNLTEDASWDLSLRLDGVEEADTQAMSRPLAAFIRALPGMCVTRPATDRVTRVEALADSAERTRWELPADVDHLAFWPLGLRAVNERPTFAGYRHLVVSPFLTDDGLATVAPGGGKLVVVSREEALEELSPTTLGRLAGTRVVNRAADLDDPDAPDDLVERDRLVGLHAKLVVVERGRRGHAFVGSANATGAAHGGNVEFMVELVGGATKLGCDVFLHDERGFGAILVDYAAAGGRVPSETDEILEALRNALRGIAETRFVTHVTASGDQFAEHVTAPPLSVPSDMTVQISLLTTPGQVVEPVSGAAFDAHLGPVELDQVTPFLLVRAVSRRADLEQTTVVRSVLFDDPADRLDEILARQVDTPEKFLRFLLLVLGLSDSSVLAITAEGPNGAGWWGSAARYTGVFELLVRALADRPEALDDLDRLIQRLRSTESGRQLMPAGFDALWRAVQEARPRLAASRRGPG